MAATNPRQPFIDRALRAQTWSRNRAQGASQRHQQAPVDTSSSSEDEGSRSVGVVSRTTAINSARRAARSRDTGTPMTPNNGRRIQRAANTPSDPRDSGNGFSQLSALQQQLEDLRMQYPHITAAVRKRLHPADVEPAPVSTASDSRWRGVDGSRSRVARENATIASPPVARNVGRPAAPPSPLPPALSRAPAARSSRGSLGEPPRVALFGTSTAGSGVRFDASARGSAAAEAAAAASRRGAAAAAAVARMGSAADASLTRSNSSSSVASTAAPLVSTLAHELQVRAPVHV